MISSSYFPPSTPQRDNSIKSNPISTTTTPNKSSNFKTASPDPSTTDFKSMPVNEILSSANSRSAFLQSLQRSREREEKREREFPVEKEQRGIEMTKAYSEYEKYSGSSSSYDNGINDKKYNGSLYDYDSSKSKSNDYAASASNPYDLGKSRESIRDTCDANNLNLTGTPIMSRRRLSSNSNSNFIGSSYNNATSTLSPKNSQPQSQSQSQLQSNSQPQSQPQKQMISSSPLKPLNTSTPLSQSKLSSHAFTMPCTDEIDYRAKEDFSTKFSENSSADFRKKYEDNYNFVANQHSKHETATDSNVSNSYKDKASASNSSYIVANTDSYTTKSVPTPSHDDLKSLIDTIVESHTASLKNDIQNLHIELIKQSVAQQSAFRSLLETYLPMTNKLMETLSETREENERLKLRIEEFSRRR